MFRLILDCWCPQSGNPPPKSSPPHRSTDHWRTMPPPPPELIDDVTAEIFLRVPPDEPKHLIRASLVCKRWFRLLTDPDFLRRYRAFHRSPPLLGYMHLLPRPRLIRTTAAPLAPIPCFRRALFCRHGRILIHFWYGTWNYAVWDPISGDRQLVARADINWLVYSAAVFCAVRGCDHLDCRGGPFQVVFFIATDDGDHHVKLCLYSSETGEWSTPVSLGNDSKIYVHPRRGAVIADEVYFMLLLGEADTIGKYDLRKNCLSMIDLPTQRAHRHCALMEMEDSSLGFAYIEGSSLHLWSRKVNSEGAAEWVQFRVIESVTMMIPVANPDDKAYVVGAAGGVGVIFVSTGAGLFTIKINSGQVTKIRGPDLYFSILPYMSFYTPGRSTIANKAKD